ncbi:CZB domain-containing protein [Sulfurimonas sp.]
MHVSNGKIDHIALKLNGYKALFQNENPSIPDESSCRFGKWFAEVANTLLKGNSLVSSITKHHQRVHQGLIKAIELYKNGNASAAVEEIRIVEESSDVGFKELLNAVKESHKTSRA